MGEPWDATGSLGGEPKSQERSEQCNCNQVALYSTHKLSREHMPQASPLAGGLTRKTGSSIDISMAPACYCATALRPVYTMETS